MRTPYLTAACLFAILCLGARPPQHPEAVGAPPAGDRSINVTPLIRSGGDAAEACAQLGAATGADASLPDGLWTRDGDCGAGAIDFHSMRFADGAGGTCRVIGSERRQCAAIVHAECGGRNVQWQILRPGEALSQLMVFHTADGVRGALEVGTIARCPLRRAH